MRRTTQPKFGREIQQRKAFLKALLTALIAHGRIQTTTIRAKAVHVVADKLVTQAKHGTIASRAGGYTRVLKLSRRASDGSPMAVVEFVK
jgi:large subunit ribosomal protein L17